MNTNSQLFIGKKIKKGEENLKEDVKYSLNLKL
jgi:hypothetical protein